MSESKIIPNSYQTPNFYADDLMYLLTSSEWKVLSYAIRRIFGFNSRRATISISMFTDGFTTREGVTYHGTGLGNEAVMTAIDGLLRARILLKVADNDKALNYGATYSLQLDSEQIDMIWLTERAEQKSVKDAKRTMIARSVQQNGGGDVQQKVKTHETHETHMAQAPEKTSSPLPLDWQIATEQPAISMPTEEQEWQAKVDLACMSICKYGADLESLAHAFITARRILPGKRDVKGWASAFRELKSQGVTPEHVRLAIQTLAEKSFPIADPWSIKKIAIDKANPINPTNKQPAVHNGAFYG